MKLPPGSPVIVASSPEEAAEKIREALGASPGEEVRVVTPQFNRSPEEAAPGAPPSPEALRSLASRPLAELRELGLRPWNNPSDPPAFRTATLMLLPAEWYEHLPAGLPIVDIFGREEVFQPGVTDDDRRFGCLSYGVLVPLAS